MSGTFPEYQSFWGAPDADPGVYDSNATVRDDALLEWLMSLPDSLKDIHPLNDESHPTLITLPPFAEILGNWSAVRYPLPEVSADDGTGTLVNVGHPVLMEGPGGVQADGELVTLLVRALHRCGEIQFSSFHTAEFFDYVGLAPQDLVLAHTFLEFGACRAPATGR